MWQFHHQYHLSLLWIRSTLKEVLCQRTQQINFCWNWSFVGNRWRWRRSTSIWFLFWVIIKWHHQDHPQYQSFLHLVHHELEQQLFQRSVSYITTSQDPVITLGHGPKTSGPPAMPSCSPTAHWLYAVVETAAEVAQMSHASEPRVTGHVCLRSKPHWWSPALSPPAWVLHELLKSSSL